MLAEVGGSHFKLSLALHEQQFEMMPAAHASEKASDSLRPLWSEVL